MGKLVALDAGHGKSTPGKRSCDESLKEYEFNRSIVNRIKPILERHGVRVIITAPDDADISLNNRCVDANNAKADIFVSCHANASDTDDNPKTWETGHGWEIFICKGSIEGRKLAEAIQSESIPFLGLSNRGIKDDPLYVTTYTKMPAVLIEHAFMTNLKEVELLKSDSFRDKCALADAKGILKYLGIAYQEPAPTVTKPDILYKVQVGAFSKKENADKLAAELKGKGYSVTVIKSPKA